MQVDYRDLKPPAAQFSGACVETGATSSVVGLSQAQAYYKESGRPFQLIPSKRRFRFDNGSQKSLGTIELRLPTPIGSFIRRPVDVVSADIPLLLGLDLMRDHGFIIDLPAMEIHQRTEGWSIELAFKVGHLFVEWDWATVLYTRAELEKMNLHFFHPSAQKLYNLVKRARPSNVDKDTLSTLDTISKAFATCATLAARGLRFKVSMPDEGLVFNHTLSADLMFLDGRAVLHVFDTATGFGNSDFLQGHSLEDVWAAFVTIW